MGESLRTKLLDLHYNLMTRIDSDNISNEETEILNAIDQSVLEYIQKCDILNGVEC